MRKPVLYLTAAACAVLIALSLVGCEDKKDEELEKILNKTRSSATITLYFPEDNSSSVSGKAPTRDCRETISNAALAEINRRLSAELNIVLEIIHFPKYRWIDENNQVQNGYNEYIYQMLKSGEWMEYDESRIDSPYVATDSIGDAFFVGNEIFRSLAESGLMADISGLLPEYAPELYKRYDTERLEKSEYNGNLFVLPSLMEDGLRYYAIIREDLLRAAGMDSIKTFEDYERFMASIKDTRPEIIPGSVDTEVRTKAAVTYFYSSGMPVDMFSRPYAQGRGYMFIDEYTGLVCKRNDPEMKIMGWETTSEAEQGRELLERWTQNGYLKPEKEGMNNSFDDNSTDLLTGKLGSCIGTWQQAVRINDMLMENRLTQFRVKAFPLYQEETGVKVSPISAAIGFNDNSPNIERCLEFFQWIQKNQENYDLFMYGLMGEDYNLIGEQLDISAGLIPESCDYYFDWRKAAANIGYMRTNISSSPDFKDELEFNTGYNTEYSSFEGWYPDFSFMNLPVEIPGFSGTFSIYDRENWFITDVLLSRKDRHMKEFSSDINIQDFQQQLDEWRIQNK